MQAWAPSSEPIQSPVVCRRASLPSDWKQIREICCESAEPPREDARQPFFGELWVGPYQKLYPEWTWVVSHPLSFHSSTNQVLGYLTGCPDTRAFLPARRRNCDLPLFLQLLRRKYAWSPDASRFTRRTLLREKGPEQSFPPDFLNELYTQYPAHLHMNVRPGYRNLRLGRQLLEAYFSELRECEVPGVHLFCGEAPLRFYQKAGFEPLSQIQFGPSAAPVYALGRKI